MAIGWLLLTERGGWREEDTTLAVGCLLALAGAQLRLIGDDVTSALAYLLSAADALLDWTDGSLGPVGVLLAAGATLLGASLVGLRLRHDVAA